MVRGIEGTPLEERTTALCSAEESREKSPCLFLARHFSPLLRIVHRFQSSPWGGVGGNPCRLVRNEPLRGSRLGSCLALALPSVMESVSLCILRSGDACSCPQRQSVDSRAHQQTQADATQAPLNGRGVPACHMGFACTREHTVG